MYVRVRNLQLTGGRGVRRAGNRGGGAGAGIAVVGSGAAGPCGCASVGPVCSTWATIAGVIGATVVPGTRSAPGWRKRDGDDTAGVLAVLAVPAIVAGEATTDGAGGAGAAAVSACAAEGGNLRASKLASNCFWSTDGASGATG